MYYVVVRELFHGVLHYIQRRRLLKPGDRVGVAVSGGADSVALLRLLGELRNDLGIVLSVVHFNHKLRGAESDGDEKFVGELAGSQGLELHTSSGDTAGYAAQNYLSVEAAARALRYQHFRELLEHGGLTRIATAHTLDDQAETVLLRLVRGAGTRGLAGIYPQLSVSGSPSQVNGLASRSDRAVIRPLLTTERAQLREYLARLGQEWREDGSNRDLRFARNRVRHGVLPRLERNLNPEVRRALAETAEIARAEEDYWEVETQRILQGLGGKGTIELPVLQELPLALQRRAVRAVGESLGLALEFRQVEEILAAAESVAARLVTLPGGWTVSRQKNQLRFEQGAEPSETTYEYRLAIPGEVLVAELGVLFEARVLMEGHPSGYNPEHLFDPLQLPRELTVRNWRPGDRFWPAHTKSPKKIKELLQEQHVTGPQRQTWPVVTSGDEIIWVRGFPGPARLRPPKGTGEAVVIREKPAARD